MSSVQYLAADLGPSKIRVNAISAGPIKTLAASGIGDFRYILRWNEYNSPLRRTVTIEEVGETAVFLVSDMSRGITGEIMHVDAGYHVVGHCDVTDSASIDAVFAEVEKLWGKLDFVVHCIAFSDKDELTGRYVETSEANFTKSLLISCYSFTAITQRAEKLMPDGGAMLTLTYYGAEKWMPHYNVMGVAKAALESSVQYLAADLGPSKIRVNAISAGPIKTLAASGIGDFRYILRWNEYNSPLRRTVTIDEVGDSGFYLLSDLSRGVTGEILHVDSGYHIVGMKNPTAPDMSVNNGGE